MLTASVIMCLTAVHAEAACPVTGHAGTVLLAACILAVIALSVWLAYGSAVISSGVYLKAFCRERTEDKRVYLTFDDGPVREITPEVLDVLDRHSAKACFFCIGSRIKGNEDIIGRAVSSGHTVGIHSWSHSPFLPFFGRKKIYGEIISCREALESIAGKDVRLFRPPFGVTDPAIAAAVKMSGCQTVGWSIRTFDTMGKTPEEVLAKVRRKLHPGAVILMHDRLPDCPATLDLVLTYLESQGYAADRRIDDNFHGTRGAEKSASSCINDLSRQ